MKKRRRKLPVIPLAVILLIVVILYLVFGTKLGSMTTNKSLRISEVASSNKGTVPDDNGKYSDWVEIENTTDKPIELNGYGLSDNKVLVKWLFPKDTVIPAHGFLVVWCSGDVADGEMHAGFKLSTDDEIALFDGAGAVIDGLRLRATDAGMTLSRDESGNYIAMAPSPGYANTPEGQQLFINSMTVSSGSEEGIGVYINEFMPSNASTLRAPDGSYSDWIELYNTNSYEVDLSGYGISDTLSQPLKYVFPEGTKIAPNGCLLIYCTGNKGTSTTQIEVPFGLRSYQEAVVFATPKGKILDSHEYSRAESDQSYVRTGYDGDYWQVSTSPTPGFANNAGGVAAYQATLNYGKGELVISELMNANSKFLPLANGEYPDWIEVHNTTGQALNLSGYALSKNAKNPAKWVFPDVTLGAGEYLVVLCTGNNVKNPSTVMETNFGISRDGDTVFLFSPEAEMLDRVEVGVGHNNISVGRDTTGALMYYATATPGAANAAGVPGYAPKPEFGIPAGVYTAAQSISIEIPEGGTVYYTTDGTAPTTSSTVYSGPIPAGNGVTVVRAAVAKSGYFLSDIASATYIVNTGAEEIEDHLPSLPVVSIVTDPDYLFGSVRGIYVAGADYQEKSSNLDHWDSFTIDKNSSNKYWKYANFNAQHITHPDPMGREWERPAHVDYIGRDGKLIYQGELVVRIFGAFSRYEKQKGFALVARPEFGDNMINCALFDNRPYTSYKAVTLRCSAMDWKFTKIRDVLIQSLLEDGNTSLPTQAYVQVAVYLNGKYWAVYNMREKVNKYFLGQHFNVNPESIDLLVGNGSTTQAVISGDPNAYKDYQALVEYCRNNDLSIQANYDYVCSKMDVENFAEYCAMEIYVGNTDTGNIKFWRSSEMDGKWRWIPYDFDWALNYDSGESKLESTTGWRRDFFTKYFHPDGHGAGRGFSTVISRALLKNKTFRSMFLQKCALMLDIFDTNKMDARIDELSNNISGEMKYDCKKWQEERFTTWQTRINRLKESSKNVPEYYLYYCQKYFGLSDKEMTQIFGRKSSLSSVS